MSKFNRRLLQLCVAAGLSLAAPFTAVRPAPAQQAPQQLAQVPSSLTLLRSVRHGNNVNAVAFSPNSQMMASAGGDGYIRVWDVNATLQGDQQRWMRRLIAIPSRDRYATSLAFSPDSRYLVTGTFNGDVRVWDLNNCERDRPVCASSMLLERDYVGVSPVVRFSPSGRWLAASNYDGRVTLWDWASRRTMAVLEPETGAHDGERRDGRFSSLAFSPDEAYLAAGSFDDFITVWSLDPEEEFERMATVDTGQGVDSVAFSPDGEQLASGSFRGVELRSLRTHRGRLEIKDPEELEARVRINTLVYLPNGQSIFMGDNVSQVQLWDVEEREAIPAISSSQQHSRPVLTTVLSPSGNLLASGSSDGVIKLWRP